VARVTLAFARGRRALNQKLSTAVVVSQLLAKVSRDAMRTAAGTPRVLVENVTTEPQSKLVVLDDIFPLLLSSFRICEFNEYIRLLPGTRVHTTGSAFSALGEKRSIAKVSAEYERTYPSLAGSTRVFHSLRRLKAAGAYVVFIENAVRFLPILEREGIPLVFTLYPGGGFAFDQEHCDAKLRRVFASECFRGVIVTQRITRDYLLRHDFCGADKIHFIYGGVFPSERLRSRLPRRRRYGADKRTFDVCFVAHRYMEGGVDKGYDTFVDTAQRLFRRYDDIHFHVVGPWTPADGDVSAIRERFHFYGPQPTDFFPAFYARMDAILSPNVPFILRKGSFDGFPTGACTEAGICGVPVICTDELGLNVALCHGHDIVIIKPTVASSVNAIAQLREDDARWARMSEATAASFTRIFGVEAQMKPRLELLTRTFDLRTA
jgi:glycosyltransferase involved in cell wall biosynthesis